MPSTESTGRNTTESGSVSDPSGISTTGNCQIVSSKPLSAERRRTVASARRSRSSRSGESELGADFELAPVDISLRPSSTTRLMPAIRLVSSVALSCSVARLNANRQDRGIGA